MRRILILASLTLAVLLPSTAFAQFRERVKVSNIRFGFTSVGTGATRGGAFKAGQWAPVYMDLECVRDTDPEENLLIIVETTDADEAITEGSVEIPPMKKEDRINGNEMGRIPYLMPGSGYASVNVRIKGAKSGRTYGEASERTFTGLDTPQFLLLGIGTNLSGIRFPVNVQGQDDGPASRGDWVRTASVLDVGLLPDHWIGYGAVDLMILGTGSDRSFWETLANPQHEKRRRAIVEWVRHGGRLVLSTGANPELLEAVKELKEIIPAAVPPGGKRTVPSIPYTWNVGGTISERNGTIGMGGEFAVATLQPKPDRATRTVVEETGGRPLIVQGSYGQGRVSVVAFDLDRSPFTDWPKRAAFWENLVNSTAHTLPPTTQKLERYTSSRYDEFSSALQGSLDFFEGVPVVSFGWVALFILIYIILIGPVDYLFLKKVIRRLEWTWVTFPVIVISVSAAAYFAAYALKGKDLKINKVDVVDVDLAGKRVDGNTWFTLFSPRIQNYTIGIEPAGPDGEPSAWTPAVPSDAARDSILTWHAHIDQNRYGGSVGGAFSKRYKIQSGTDPVDVNRDLYAAGLERVPIQVWTTKAFHAEWSAPIDPARPPISAELTQKDGDILVGTFTNNLPIEQFSDVALFWRGKAFSLTTELPTGVAKAVSFSAATGADTSEEVKSWVTSDKRYPETRVAWRPPVQTTYGPSYSENGTTSNPLFRLWPIMFADFATESLRLQTPNASLRRLDQSWRVTSDQSEQAILVLRIPTRQGPAEDITRAGDSPSRLWLGELPTSGANRPALPGTLKQETYVRVFIPVKKAKK